jgi:hypothetical protein
LAIIVKNFTFYCVTYYFIFSDEAPVDSRSLLNTKQTEDELERAMVSHVVACMSGMKSPSKRLSPLIDGVDNAGNMMHFDVTSSSPHLDSKVLNINVARTRGGVAFIDHCDGGLVVHINRCRLGLCKTEVK